MSNKEKSLQSREPQRYISIREAAIMLSIDPSTVYRMVEQGELPAYRVTQRRLVISIQELELFMRERRTVPADCRFGREQIPTN